MQKFLLSLFLALSMLLGTAQAADLSHLIIIHTNDTHGFDMKTKENNGMAAIAALKKDYQAKGYNVLLVDAGDAIQDNNLVNFSKGKTAITFMNACGYDAMTLGNHEFDYGQDVLLQLVKEAKFPVISANVIVQATGKPLVPKDTILQKGPVKIGIFGLTTPNTLVATNPKNIYGLDFLTDEKMVQTAQNEVNKLKAAGCDLIICLCHLGSYRDSAGHRSNDILEKVSGVDLVIDGHDHLVKNLARKDSLLVSSGCHTENIGVLTHNDQGWASTMLPAGTYAQEDPAVKSLITKAANDVQKHLAKKLGTSQVALNGNRVPGVRTSETNLGDLVADSILWQARMANVLHPGDVDGAIINGGSLRNSIAAGSVTVGAVANVMPYNNQVYIMSITGAQLLEILESATSALPQAMGAFPQVAGIKYTVNTAVPYTRGKPYPHSTYYAPAKPGSRVTITEVNDKPFDYLRTYNIATLEFICRGGDAYAALPESKNLNTRGIGYMDTECFTNYLKDQLHGVIGPQYAKTQGRVTILGS